MEAEVWHSGLTPFMTILEYVGTFAAALSGVRLASLKKFDWFGAYVIGFATALGGGTIRDCMLQTKPFWMTAPSYLVVTFAAVVAVWLFGRHFLGGKITWFVYDTIGISVFMIIGLEKAINFGCDQWWCAIAMGVITAVFGGVIRDICINEVPLIFRKELYAMACAAGGLLWYVLYWVGVDDPYIRYIVSIIFIFVIRALAIKYHWGVPVLKGHSRRWTKRKKM